MRRLRGSLWQTGQLYVVLFAVYGLLSCGVVIWKLPPFMGPDELNHMKRAGLLTHGRLIGERVRVGSELLAGGPAETNLDLANGPFQPLIFRPDRKVLPSEYVRARLIPWGDNVEDGGFENTAIYPPFFYLPQSLAIGVGKAFGLSILDTLTIARVANALSCLLIGCFALRLAGRARPLLFTVLLLPMSISLYSTVTQDGMLLVTTALASAILARGLGEGRTLYKREIWGAAACFALVGMAKAPYALFGLLMGVTGGDGFEGSRVRGFVGSLVRRMNLGWWAAWASIMVALGWHLSMLRFVQTSLHRPDAVINSTAQLAYLVHHPAAILGILGHTLRHSGGEYAAQTIGVLGWLDTLLPKPFYATAFMVVAVSLAATWSIKVGGDMRRTLASLAILALAAVGVIVALYVTYTPVGAATVDGVQGRYSLPVLALLPVALVGNREPWLSKGWAFAAILGFPPLSLVVLERALAGRYWG